MHHTSGGRVRGPRRYGRPGRKEREMSEQDRDKSLQQYLTFKMGEELFALDVTCVREVLDMAVITKVPQSADFMRGVINVRGNVVPVADLHLKFGIAPVETTVNTRIVVIEIDIDGDITILGAIADSVHDVMDISADRIEPAPKIGGRFDTRFIRGIGKLDDQFIIILNIDKVFSAEADGFHANSNAAIADKELAA